MVGGNSRLGIGEAFDDTFEVGREGDAVGAVHHADVVESGVVGGTAVEQAQTAIDGEVVAEFVSGTELKSEIVLFSAHVAIDVITGHRGHGHAERCKLGVELARHTDEAVGDGADDGLEGAESVFKFAFSTAARNGKVKLNAPVAFVVGGLQRGDEGGVGHTLEFFRVLSVIFRTECEEWTLRSDGTGLVCVLPVEADMKPYAEEDNTGGVGIDTVKADGTVAGRVAKEGNTLIGIGQYAASEHGS